MGIGSLQFPEGKQTISEVPIKLLPLAQENFTREFSFVFCEPMIKLCFDGIEGQCTAILIQYILVALYYCETIVIIIIVII